VTVHSGRFRPEDRAADRWPGLPFEVPPGCSGVRVELSYDASGGAVLDLGCEGPDGWRGWSGGARSWFAITPRWATPGYYAGSLEPGEWRVVLGLHRVPAAGVPYEVRVTLGAVSPPPEPDQPPVPAAAARPPRRQLPAEPGMRWLACDFHAHTEHSDGSLTVPQLAARAAANGLDVLAVTDHNTTTHHASLEAASRRYGVHLLPGQEVTTDLGHANAFGAIPWVDFRQPPVTWRSFIEERGGLFSINHPLCSDHGWVHPLDEPPTAAEIWHWTWLDRRWTGPLAWWRAAGLGITPLGGSDFHRPGDAHRELGQPITWVSVAADVVSVAGRADARAAGAGAGLVGGGGAALTAAVLDAVRDGRTAVSAHRDGPVLLRTGDEIVALDAEGAQLLRPDGGRERVHSRRQAFPSLPGGHVLLDPENAVLSICG
jgi:PHP domain